jgi:hypothetical protein
MQNAPTLVTKYLEVFNERRLPIGGESSLRRPTPPRRGRR